jgi:hypothetical protein
MSRAKVGNVLIIVSLVIQVVNMFTIAKTGVASGPVHIGLLAAGIVLLLAGFFIRSNRASRAR